MVSHGFLSFGVQGQTPRDIGARPQVCRAPFAIKRTFGMDTRIERYIMSHGMTSIEWKHSMGFETQTIYDKYIEKWGNGEL